MNKGKTTIAPEVLHTIARLTTLNIEGVSRLCNTPSAINRLFSHGFCEGSRIEIQDDTVFIDLYVILKNGVNVREVSHNIQQQVARAISDMVGMQVGRVDVHIDDIDYPERIKA